VKDNSGMQVVVEGGGQFPESLAGKWITESEGWELNFEPNGVISKAIFPQGRPRMKPGQTTKVPMVGNGEGVYVPGDWLVEYNPENRELTVKVSLKSIHIRMGNGSIDGKTTDIFVGPVSENGKIWNTIWTNFSEYTGHTPQFPNSKMPTDPNGETNPLIFTKVEEVK
jgi:hypothetical protein